MSAIFYGSVIRGGRDNSVYIAIDSLHSMLSMLSIVSLAM